MKKRFVLAMTLGLSVAVMLGGCGKKNEDSKDATDITSEANGGNTDSDNDKTNSNKSTLLSPDFKASEYVTLGEYKGVEVSAPITTITEEELQEEIDAVLLENATEEEITGRAVENGDLVDIDFAGYLNGEAFDGGTAQGYRLEIGSASFIEGFEEGIIGMQVGEQKDLDLTFPKTYHNADLKGKAVVFKVTVNSIIKVIPAELTDDFVLENTDYETVDSYKEGLKKEMEAELVANADRNFANSVWAKVIENATVVKYPEDELQRYVEGYKANYEQYAASYNMQLDEFISAIGLNTEDYNNMIVELAQNDLKETLILKAIAQTEKMEVSDDEYNTKLGEYVTELGYESIEALLADFNKEIVVENIILQKAMEFLIDNAKEI